MQIKKIIFKNPGLKFVALVLAVLVWAMISGKERSYSEKTMDVNVEYFGNRENIDVMGVRPDKVQIKIRATSQQLNEITPDDFRIRINLQDVSEGIHNYWTENYLQFPEKMEIISIQQKMIEVTVKEFMTREVLIRVRYKGMINPGIRLVDRRLVPEKVKIFGYKSQIANLEEVEAADWVNLSEIQESTVIKIPLKKQAEILKFEDTDVVEVQITVENMSETKTEDDQKK